MVCAIPTRMPAASGSASILSDGVLFFRSLEWRWHRRAEPIDRDFIADDTAPHDLVLRHAGEPVRALNRIVDVADHRLAGDIRLAGRVLEAGPRNVLIGARTHAGRGRFRMQRRLQQPERSLA